jgi:hypothetical protein
MSTRLLERLLGAQPNPTDTEPYGAQELWTVEMARLAWVHHREANGLTAVPYPLLTPPTGNYKLAKSAVPTYGLALAQAATSGFNVCPASTPECRKHCVASAGKGTLHKVKRARVVRTTFLAANPQAFLRLLVDEIDRAVLKHGREAAEKSADARPPHLPGTGKGGPVINVRLNTFSDLPWERIAPWLFTRWGDAVAFYDYTKVWDRAEFTPDNYQLTLSATERTGRGDISWGVSQGYNVAVVVNVKRGAAVPQSFNVNALRNIPMVDGDLTDDRTLTSGVVVALRPKGTMSGKGSGMVFAV